MARPIRREIPKERAQTSVPPTGQSASKADSVSSHAGQSVEQMGQMSEGNRTGRDLVGIDKGIHHSSADGAGMVLAGHQSLQETRAEVKAVVASLADVFETEIGYPVKRMLTQVAVSNPAINLTEAVKSFFQQFDEDDWEWSTNPIGFFYETFEEHVEFLIGLEQRQYEQHASRAAFAQRMYDEAYETLRDLETQLRIRNGSDEPFPHSNVAFIHRLTMAGFAKAVPEGSHVPRGCLVEYRFQMMGVVRSEWNWGKFLRDVDGLMAVRDAFAQYLADGDLSGATGRYHYLDHLESSDRKALSHGIPVDQWDTDWDRYELE